MPPAAEDPQKRYAALTSFFEEHWACHRPVEEVLAALRTAPQETTLRVNRILWPEVSDAVEAARQLPAVASAHISEELGDVIIIPMKQNKVEPTSRQVLVDSFCGEALLRGADVFAPGVIAADKTSQVGDMVAVFAQVEDRPVLRGAPINAELSGWVAKQHFVGNGRLELPLAEIFRENKGLAIKMVDGLTDNISLMDENVPRGLFPQNLPSAAVAHALDPQPGEAILDACAGFGGKTAHICSLMKTGTVIAIDKSKRKVQECRDFLTSEGIDFCECYKGDATSSEWLSSAGKKGMLFDRVLVDAPCSATGLRPRLRYDDVKPDGIEMMAKYQQRILATATDLTKPGGVVVYSTCSITLQENEANVRWALDNLPLTLEPCPKAIGLPSISEVLAPEERELVQRFCPTGSTMGFFIARFRKA